LPEKERKFTNTNHALESAVFQIIQGNKVHIFVYLRLPLPKNDISKALCETLISRFHTGENRIFRLPGRSGICNTRKLKYIKAKN
jgi:hypothetical protein